MHNDELMHYGVLGMKWGVRKNRYSGQFTKKTVNEFQIENSEKILRKQAQYSAPILMVNVLESIIISKTLKNRVKDGKRAS